MIVLADMAARRERELGDAQLVLAIDLAEEAANRRLKPDLGNEAFGIDLDRTAASLRAHFGRAHRCRDQRQRRQPLQDFSPLLVLDGHGYLPVKDDRWRRT